jgi:DNA-binding transcriptional LysR family regulator
MSKTMLAFVRLATLGGFSPAARQLALTPSAVSKLVTRLEDRLGARLLNRTTRSLSLTPEGAVYLERAKRIVAEIEQAEAEITAFRKRHAASFASTCWWRSGAASCCRRYRSSWSAIRIFSSTWSSPINASTY